MVRVNMRIHEEANGPRVNFSHGGENLVADLQILRIHHEDAVGPGEHTNPSACTIRMSGIHVFRTGQHVEVRSNFIRQDFDPVIRDRLPLAQ